MNKRAFRLSGSCILKFCLALFVASNFCLFYYLLDSEWKKSERYEQRELNSPFVKILHEHFRKVNNEWRLKSLDSTTPNDLNCSFLHNIRYMKFVAAGWTKATFQVKQSNKTFAVKVVHISGHDVEKCFNKNKISILDCYKAAASKILLEIYLLKSLEHTNVVRVLGYCIPEVPDFMNHKNTIAVIEEFGKSVDVISMLQLSWEDRLRVCLGLSKLLKYLSASPFGSVSLNDFRRQQFVLIDGELKLIDVDDIGLKEPKCAFDNLCCIGNTTLCVSCADQVCHGYNEKLNIIQSGKHFITHLLPYGAPSFFNNSIHKILQFHKSATLRSSTHILNELKNLTEAFAKGFYQKPFNSSLLSRFKMVKNNDISAQFDYKCDLIGHRCIKSVFDIEEAKEICSLDKKCKAFVLTNITTWTGRKLVHFKNGMGHFIHNNLTTLFIKL